MVGFTAALFEPPRLTHLKQLDRVVSQEDIDSIACKKTRTTKQDQSEMNKSKLGFPYQQKKSIWGISAPHGHADPEEGGESSSRRKQAIWCCRKYRGFGLYRQIWGGDFMVQDGERK